MAHSWRIIRAFISSTFRDMHAERDHFVTVEHGNLAAFVARFPLPFAFAFTHPSGRAWAGLSTEHRCSLTIKGSSLP